MPLLSTCTCLPTTITCNGGCSDSGGGFTKEAMQRALIREGLAKEGVYINVNCTPHNDQTNIRNAIETVYGQSGLELRNVSHNIFPLIWTYINHFLEVVTRSNHY